MSERMDARVRAGPRSLRSAGDRRGFIAAASVRHNGLWLLSAETESDSRDSVKALDLILMCKKGEPHRWAEGQRKVTRARSA